MRRYQGRAYRLAWSLLRSAEDARDVSQEAFLRVYRTAADPGDALGRQQVMARLWAAVDRLSPQQRAAILLHVQEELPTSQIFKRWNELPEARRQELQHAWDRFQRLPPERRQRILERFDQLQKLPPEERRQLMDNFERWQRLSPEERARIRERLRAMPPEERQRLRAMPPQERQRMLRERPGEAAPR